MGQVDNGSRYFNRPEGVKRILNDNSLHFWDSWGSPLRAIRITYDDRSWRHYTLSVSAKITKDDCRYPGLFNLPGDQSNGPIA